MHKKKLDFLDTLFTMDPTTSSGLTGKLTYDLLLLLQTQSHKHERIKFEIIIILTKKSVKIKKNSNKNNVKHMDTSVLTKYTSDFELEIQLGKVYIMMNHK